ncbi:lignin-forming anionic peroxidase-like [Euphorbia lathyris]|uniref:lignin-forming anionic peroxidase-like n=1 Tax=Euphorbia lathyris TaxID=212925 RepID=UPI0033142405
MATSPQTGALLIFMLLLINVMAIQAHLSSKYYEKSCPKALFAIPKSVRTAIAQEKRMAASLIRLHFHDCFVQGCDASILLNETSSEEGEKTAIPNNSVRGYEVIDNAKSKVEKLCPGVVSWADIIAVAARDASVYAGGPSWSVKLGRKDSKTANKNLTFIELPSFSDGLHKLISRFKTKGFTARDMVALSGSHTLGQAQCGTFRERIYNNKSNIDAGFARSRRRSCPAVGGDRNLAALDLVTPNSFDNRYFKNLIEKKGLLHSDQVLFSGGYTDNIVLEYSRNNKKFYSDFASAMIKMGNLINPSRGEIRRICSVVN